METPSTTTRQVAPTEDLNARIDQANDGDTFYLDPGTHAVDRPIRAGPDGSLDHISLIGSNRGSTQIRRAGEFPLFEFAGPHGSISGWRFENLLFSTGAGDSADLIRTSGTKNFYFRNCGVWMGGCSGNTIDSTVDWDWDFDHCFFGRGGDPSGGGAAIWARNGGGDNTNNWNFVNCRFEPVVANAIRFEDTGSGGRCGRFRLVNCKFHGQQPQNNTEDDFYSIDGTFSGLSIVGCEFIWKRGRNGDRQPGHIRQWDTALGLRVVNSSFRRFDGPAIDISGYNNAITNNYFYGNWANDDPADSGQEAIRVRSGGARTVVTNNVVERCSGIRVSGSGCPVTGNVLDTSITDSLVVDGPNCRATANVPPVDSGPDTGSGTATPIALTEHEIHIEGSGQGVDYALAVSGRLWKSDRDASINAGDELTTDAGSGGRATGFVGGGADAYRFTGRIVGWWIETPMAVTVRLDGRTVDSETLQPTN